ncbi:hypothetical protein BHU72_01955 [Desulfuribacillus stibiiarsenatis]|uniref:DAC domain-containing protein n=1 Tax=Desulfuribacillus stibiiarsenatis TaxID=1390249 RepID=A0A1E5L613_9FIRM|nr:hypothetical protein [Desulfuribacillus stibiiarsenatis]OEH85587.1 hypothetical protein BHU72_01955 [Desulfuribacillus stibiiarsenatis]
MIKTEIKEIEEFINALQEYLSEYVGYQIKLTLNENETEELVAFDLHTYFHFSNPDFKKSVEKLANMSKQIIKKDDYSVDWEVFHKLKNKLSVSYVFGTCEDEKIEFQRLQFLSDIIELSHRTYESINTTLGLIYSSAIEKRYIKEHYGFEIIEFESPISIKELFKEKPLLRVVDGEILNILIDENLLAYGFAINKHVNENFSEKIKNDFEKKRIFNNFKIAKRSIIENYEEILANKGDQILIEKNSEDEKLFMYIVNLFKGGLKNANLSEDNNAHNLIYFKIDNRELNIYNHEECVVAFSKGQWRLKNYHFLQYLLIQHVLLRAHIFFMMMEPDKIGRNLQDLFDGITTLYNVIRKLSSENTSSIIMFVPNEVDNLNSYSEIDELEAKNLLGTVPLKEIQHNSIYLNLIKDNGKHLNVRNISENYLSMLCSIDGALVLDYKLNILTYGAIIDTSFEKSSSQTYGTGTNACEYASKDSLAIKISEDGDIKVYQSGKNVLNI